MRLSTGHTRGVVPGEISAVAHLPYRLDFSENTQILVDISAELVFPVIDDVPIPFHQPFFRNRSQATHVAHAISDGSVECNYGCWVMTK